MYNESLHEKLGYVMASSYRIKVIKFIGHGVKMPSDISDHMGVRINHISTVLSDLKKENLVVCLNEEAYKGRLYKNTQLALDILDYIKDDEY